MLLLTWAFYTKYIISPSPPFANADEHTVKHIEFEEPVHSGGQRELIRIFLNFAEVSRKARGATPHYYSHSMVPGGFEVMS